jgi:hypothetical protein
LLSCRASPATSSAGQAVIIELPPLDTDSIDADGEDDGVREADIGPRVQRLAAGGTATITALPLPADAHPLVCDLTPFNGALYAATAVKPIDIDGATIHRFDPADGVWSLAFDWDRDCVPYETHEVGGQGIARVRAIDGRLFATDADAPLYGGFGLSNAPFEDYVFVSDEGGVFPPLGDGATPPQGTKVLPFAFHAFDVISYRGALVATGGTVALSDTSGTRYPGGLFAGNPADPVLPPRFFPGEGEAVGVVRTTYAHRFGGRLYVGFQNNEKRLEWDLAVLTGDPRDEATAPPVLARATSDGGWVTRRFASGDGWLYWVASGYRRDRRGSALFESRDGATFRRVRLPSNAGAIQDIVVVEGARFALTTAGVYRSRDRGAFELIAAAPDGDPFGGFSTFCSAPLTVFDDALYAGGTRGGTVYRIDPAD